MPSDPRLKPLSLADHVALAQQHEDQIRCDCCTRDLSRNGYADWRIVVRAEEVPQLYPSYDPDPKPLDGGPFYFCNTECLNAWRAEGLS